MHPGVNRYIQKLRIEAKAKENQNKLPLASPDIMQTVDFVFSQIPYHGGDSGKLLLAKRKSDRSDRYLVKHAYLDCAANEFIYTKLTQAMGYCMPDAVLFQLSPEEKRPYFKTEYIIGERYMNFIRRVRSFHEAREHAKNGTQYFSFQALYSITDEGDKLEIYLAEDDQIYRVDTTDAFPLHDRHYDSIGMALACSLHQHEKITIPLPDISSAALFRTAQCDQDLKQIKGEYPDGQKYYLEPFARMQEISSACIDDFLNTLCYFYPDCIGDFFKQYLTALQGQCYAYWKEKR